MRSHSARSSRKAELCCSMYVRTALSGVWLMVTSLSARTDILGGRFLTLCLRGRPLQKQPLQCGPVRQALRSYHFTGSDVQEGRVDGRQGDAPLLGPGEPVQG